MHRQTNKMELLGSAPVPRALLALGLPTMLGMLINAMYNLADAYFVGGLGTAQMGAITVAYPLGQVVVGLGLLFGNGAASCLSRLLGNGERETADKVASTALYGSVLVGAAVIACCMAFLEPLLRRIGADGSVMPYALSYTGIYLACSIFNVFNGTLNNIVSSEGAARTTMCVLLAGAALNVALDPVFIYVLDLGVAGAAVATGLSQAVSTLIYLGYILRKKSLFHFRIRQVSCSREVLPEILKIGVPTLAFQLLTSLSMSMINDGARAYGPSALAAMGPVTKIMSVGSLMVFGFLKGLQPIAGFSYGSRNYARLREAVKTAILWSTVFCALFALVAALGAPAILAQFTRGDAELIRIGQAALRANALTFVLFGFYTVYSFLFLAMGKAGAGCLLGACRQGICFVPALLILSRVWGLGGILCAQPVSDVLSAAVAAIMALGLHRRLAAEGAAPPAA